MRREFHVWFCEMCGGEVPPAYSTYLKEKGHDDILLNYSFARLHRYHSQQNHQSLSNGVI